MRTAIVFGGSEGIGLACASALRRDHHRICIAARSTDKLHRARKELGESEVMISSVDLRDPEGIDRVFGEVEAQWGVVDVVVISGGGPVPGHVLTLSDQDWQVGFELIGLSMIRIVRRAIPKMRERKWGRIVVIGSISAREPVPGLDISNFMRSGLASIVKSLSRETSGYGVNVNMVCPGFIRSHRSASLMEKRAKDEGVPISEIEHRSAARVPVGRMGRTEEVGDVVAFLASDRASYVTGTSIIVDGGLTISP